MTFEQIATETGFDIEDVKRRAERNLFGAAMYSDKIANGAATFSRDAVRNELNRERRESEMVQRIEGGKSQAFLSRTRVLELINGDEAYFEAHKDMLGAPKEGTTDQFDSLAAGKLVAAYMKR